MSKYDKGSRCSRESKEKTKRVSEMAIDRSRKEWTNGRQKKYFQRMSRESVKY